MNGKTLKWLIDYNVSKRHMTRVNAFYTACLELQVELREAKQLGMCSTTTFGNLGLGLRNQDSTWKNGGRNTSKVTIHGNEKSVEMSS